MKCRPASKEFRFPDLSVTRWTLFELFAMVTVAGAAAHFASTGGTALGVCLLVTAISVRTATVDFSIAGAVANVLVLLFGIPMLFLVVLWAVERSWTAPLF